MEKVSVVLIDREVQSLQRVRELLEDAPGIEVVDRSTDLHELDFHLSQRIVAVILVGPGYQIEDVTPILERHSVDLAFVSVILLAEEVSAGHLRQALKLNVRDVLEVSCSREDLLETIQRAYEISRKVYSEKVLLGEGITRKEGHPRARVVVVFGPKGGCGKSFLATNLAVGLEVRKKGPVVLFDMNYQSGDVAIMLGLFPQYTVYDVTADIDSLDKEMLSRSLTPHGSGVKVLPAPLEFQQAQFLTDRATGKMVRLLAQMNNFIIIDTDSSFSDHLLAVLDQADHLCMVASNEVPSIKNLKLGLQILGKLNFPEEKILIVLNRAGTKVGLSPEEIEETIQRKIDAAIPSDKVVPISVNKGVPVITQYPRSPVSKRLFQLVELLSAEKVGRGR
ncbi:pilus assembly protein CpaE [Candidatus Hakubella thermalkaliphila]|uniref:Pilus assembly protein CpaE n=1 Tax=Candidatus Hakubella thermalkaliphila TaxID=2754717 RepID=A0A6V8PML1_9ACTN|nr:pilus assembly protein CpaE [Candidatus Hakubella thermalkaliphila]